MKKLILFSFLLSTSLWAQNDIVYIPDTNFKKTLLDYPHYSGGTHIDLNHDNEIQVSEAEAVVYLYIDRNHSYYYLNDLTGIEAFKNLEVLDCSDNHVQKLNVKNLTKLKRLYCSNNEITNLDVSNLTELKQLDCYNNEIAELDVSNLTNLFELVCYNNKISVLDVKNLVKLSVLLCNNNNISILEISNLPNLKFFECDNNQISELNVNPNITYINSFYCYNNKLTKLFLPPNFNIGSLAIGNPGLQFPDLSNLNVYQLSFTNSDWNNVDLSSMKMLETIYFYDNVNLESVNMKNGINKEIVYFFKDYSGKRYGVSENNPKLKFICIEENQIAKLKDSLMKYKMNVDVNSYCSFDLTGNFNTIKGKISFNNKDCDSINTFTFTNIKVKINDNKSIGATFTDTTGYYKFFTNSGTFNLNPSFETPNYFKANPISQNVAFSNNFNNVDTVNFCITPNGVHPDLEIIVAPVGVARPGFDANYQVVYKNKGNQTLSGNLNVTYNDAVLDFLSSSVSATASSGNLAWTYTNLKPFESKVIDLKFNVNSPMETPAVNLGDTLKFIATINPTTGDDTPNDNTFEFNQIVVGAYDPNQITCLEGTNLDPVEAGNYLHYFIECENTGTYPAENVVMKVVVDTLKYDLNSLQVLSSSDPVYVRINRNVVEYVFENIQLAEKAHGNVLVKIKSRSTLTKGDYVAKQANIYFDYNFPVTTNEAMTVYQIFGLGLKDLVADASIVAFPNPNNGIFQVKSEQAINSIHVYDQYGRLLETRLNPSPSQSNFDLSNEAKGLYFLKVTTDKGVKVLEISKD